eukprot:336244_1
MQHKLLTSEKLEPCKPTEKLLTNTKLLAIFFVQLNEAYQITVLLPMVVFMCRDFGIASQWLGIYTSILNCSFGFSQFCVSYVWGYMSDIHGRRSILIIGLIGTFLAMTIFGFSTSFEMALLCRCACGFFNGNLAVVKSYCADITDSSNRGYAFSMIGVSWGAGSILGSLLGGILLETNDVDAPDNEYIRTTSVLKWTIFEHDYPFLLPTGVCGGLIALNALIWTLIFIHNVPQKRNAKRTNSVHYSDMTVVTDSTIDITSDIEMTSAVSNPSAPCQSIDRPPVYEHRDLAMHHSLPSYHDLKAMLTSFEGDRMELLSHVHENKSIDDTVSEQIRTVSDFFKHTLFGHTLLQYGILVISYYMFKEMGPVFMAQTLSFDSMQIGYTQVCAGATYFIWAVTIQPILLRKVKHTVLTGYCIVISAICALLMPSIYWFTLIKEKELAFMNEEWWSLIMVCVVECIGTMASSVLFTTIACWLNNSVPDMFVGKANGIGQTLSAFVKGFGPLLTGFIWSESITQIQADNTHYAVYYAYIPAAVLYLPMLIDTILYIPSNLQLTWMQREEEILTKK